MSAVKPLNKNAAKGKAQDKQYVSNCKLCPCGIFNTDERTWGRGWYLGWCHTECVEAEAKRAQLLAELNRERFGGAAC